MDALGIDQSELARRVGCTAAAINQIVVGKTQHSRFLPAIARELGLPLPYLAGDIDDPNKASTEALLTTEESEWLGLLRGLPKKDRAALLHLARTISTSALSPALHARRHEFRA